MKTILVIEDDQGINELLVESIQQEGYTTKSFFNGSEALKWLENNNAYLIILDYRLNDMNGSEFILELNNKLNKKIPFVVSTGQGDERIAVEMMKLGAKDYIIKDANFLVIIALIVKQVCVEIENKEKLIEVQNTLKQREAYLTAIFNNLPGIIWLKDPDGKFLMNNKSFANICGFNDPSELLGKTDFDIWPKDLANKYTVDDYNVIQSKTSIQKEEIVLVNNEKRIYHTFKTPIFDADEHVIGTAGYSMDITDRKEFEDKLSKKIEELKFLNSFMVDRELRMVELKKEINELLEKAGLDKRYT